MSCSTTMADPNFPQGLRIQPSSSRRRLIRPERAAAAPARAATEEASRWDQDTQQDIEQYGIAGRIWEAAYLIVAYLKPAYTSSLQFDPPCSAFQAPETSSASSSAPSSSSGAPSQSSHGRIVALELGSGVGFGGLHFAQQLRRHRTSSNPLSQRRAGTSRSAPDTVVLTDLPNVVPLMERNAAGAGLLRKPSSESVAEPVEVLVRSLVWGDRDHATEVLKELRARAEAYSDGGLAPADSTEPHPLTHILCSDLVYFPELLPPLLRSLIDLTDACLPTDAMRPRNPSLQSAPSSPEIIISYKIRSLTKEQPFWSAFGAWFDYQAVDCHRKKKGRARKADRVGDNDGWHRFGSRVSDMKETLEADTDTDAPTASNSCSALGDADDEEGEEVCDELFVFVAKRRAETFGCRAPQDDGALMLGRRLRWTLDCSSEAELEAAGSLDAKGCWKEEEGANGQDFFEWILLSGMGSIF
ncbi:hypothetical protein ACQY0O_004543 [Thecaphora frezii]